MVRVVESLFPDLFGFKFCSILFADNSSGNMYKIKLTNKLFKTDEEKAEIADNEGGERQEEEVNSDGD